MNRRPPLFIRIILADFQAYQSAIFAGIIFLIFLFDLVFPVYGVWFTYFTLAVIVFSAFVFYRRVSTVTNLLENGVETPGLVEQCIHYRGKVKITYSFKFRGESYSSENDYLRTRLTGNIKAGDPATLLVDPENPKRMINKHLYKLAEI